MFDFNVGFPEVVTLAIIGIIIFGPEKLPDLARKAGRVINYVRGIANDARSTIQEELGSELADLDPRALHPKTFAKQVLGDALVPGAEVAKIGKDLTELKDEWEVSGQSGLGSRGITSPVAAKRLAAAGVDALTDNSKGGDAATGTSPAAILAAAGADALTDTSKGGDAGSNHSDGEGTHCLITGNSPGHSGNADSNHGYDEDLQVVETDISESADVGSDHVTDEVTPNTENPNQRELDETLPTQSADYDVDAT